MKKDPIKDLFEKMHCELDIHKPSLNHRNRFLDRLQEQNEVKDLSDVHNPINWYRPLAIAASIAILFGVFLSTYLFDNKTPGDLASVSPEMEQTQSFFVTAIATQLEEIKEKASPETQELVNDALNQIEKLESDYQKLKVDLVQSGNDQRVISAMIKNFQKRANLLDEVLQKINTIKTLKQTENENFIL